MLNRTCKHPESMCGGLLVYLEFFCHQETTVHATDAMVDIPLFSQWLTLLLMA